MKINKEDLQIAYDIGYGDANAQEAEPEYWDKWEKIEGKMTLGERIQYYKDMEIMEKSMCNHGKVAKDCWLCRPTIWGSTLATFGKSDIARGKD